MNEEKFQSSLAPYIIEFIKYQQKIGRVYKHGEIMLHKFDVFCIDVKFSESVLTKVLVEKWCDYNKSLRVRAQSQHLTYIRQLGTFLSAKGIKTYVPPKKCYSGTADPIVLSSPLAPYIEDFLAQKRADGYSYESGARVLHRFDRFCMDQRLKSPILSWNLVMKWLEVTTASNATYIRQFALYLVSLGMDAYVAGAGRSKSSYVPHVFNTEELTAFFEQVDHFSAGYRSKPRMAMAYSVMFRLYYSVPLNKEQIDLSYMMVQIVDEAYPLLTASCKEVITNIPHDLCLYADSEKMARVFNNLLKNAIAYSDSNSTIEIFAEQSETAVKIYFKNNGEIPKDKLNTVFEKFCRLDQARQSSTGGAGLGLAIAKDIVALHNGAIYAHSKEGHTIITIELPNGV